MVDFSAALCSGNAEISSKITRTNFSIMKTAYRPQFAPFEPSKLRFESSPLVPASPLVPQCNRSYSHKPTDADCRDTPTSGQEPPLPISWTWFCHLCRVHYPLGATRKCLNDGHSVCRGRAVTKDGMTTHPRLCHKEFDYFGWRIWGRWSRHKSQDLSSQTYEGRNLLHQCNFPAECMGDSGYYGSYDDAWTTVEANHESWNPLF